MPDPTPTAEPRPQPTPAGSGRRRVLVVEDEYMIAQDLARELEDVGAEVLGPVPSVADALALLVAEAVPPDAAILDVNLGGEMVFPVAEALRERGVPFVFVTGYDPWSLPQAYADVPCCEKPFDVGRCMWSLFGTA